LLSMVSCGDMYNKIFKERDVKVYSTKDTINSRLADSPSTFGNALITKSYKANNRQEINPNAKTIAFTKPNANPIPVQEHLMVTFVASAQQAVSIRLLDLQGRVVVKHNLVAAGGKEKFKLSLNNQKNGPYVLEVLAKTEHEKVQIVKQSLSFKRWMIINNELVVA
ncbi:MAG: hypothetical protein M3142_15645, partial [Bacteroidota bacterium]|nr:hypothetical protein [Bacteroidota bacterium]